MKKVAILQSNYIPWKGYFDLINMVDEFILYDEVQYSKNDWRNRNVIKTANGLQWLTIPVLTSGKSFMPINTIEIKNSIWVKKHWKTIYFNYNKAEHFDRFSNMFINTYEKCKQEKYLSKVNYLFIKLICKITGIKTKISWSTDFTKDSKDKTKKLIQICQAARATSYLTGPAARDYIDKDMFDEAEIYLDYIDYSNYPEYYQLNSPFEHTVSIIDLIFNTGYEAQKYMKSFQ